MRTRQKAKAVLMVAIAIAVVGALNWALVCRCEAMGMEGRWFGRGVYCLEKGKR